ncbi:DAW1 factor, partial [Picathartes gymnocephalus]|nr:DAW1 factor [Picathartes gymnocephalus]
TGKCCHTFRGHSAEIVCLSFNPQSTLLATGSMDTTAKLWDLEKGEEVATLNGHSAEIIALSFNTTGDRIITGSFDHTVAVWDVGTGREQNLLIKTPTNNNAAGKYELVYPKKECSARVCVQLWNAVTGTHIATLAGHSKEVLDVCFDYAGQCIATASADGSARVYNAATKQCIAKLEGHEDEISKVS